MKNPTSFLKKWYVVNKDFLKSSLVASELFEPELVAAPFQPEEVGNLSRNVDYKNKYTGGRVFILCTGPSISKMNLLPLKNEICFSVSNFYKHSDFSEIRPKYHFVPNVFSPHTDESTSIWFSEMRRKVGPINYFLGLRQKDLVEKENLFSGANVNYLDMSLPGEKLSEMQNIDLTVPIPGVQSVPVMCMMAAIYMGFSKIYLLGADHNALFTNRYDYFYARSEMISPDPAVNADGSLKDSRYEVMVQTANLWKQYIELKRISSSLGSEIVNLTPNSYLDVFPFSKLEHVLEMK